MIGAYLVRRRQPRCRSRLGPPQEEHLYCKDRPCWRNCGGPFSYAAAKLAPALAPADWYATYCNMLQHATHEHTDVCSQEKLEDNEGGSEGSLDC